MALRKKRAPGLLEIQIPKLDITPGATEDDPPQFAKEETTVAHNLVAEFMVATGTRSAEFLAANNVIAPYRGQRQPDEIGLQLVSKLRAGGFADPVVGALSVITHLHRAEPSATPSPHFSMGVNNYMHVTSPIRRYSDLITQRIIKSIWRREIPLTQFQNVAFGGSSNADQDSLAEAAHHAATTVPMHKRVLPHPDLATYIPHFAASQHYAKELSHRSQRFYVADYAHKTGDDKYDAVVLSGMSSRADQKIPIWVPDRCLLTWISPRQIIETLPPSIKPEEIGGMNLRIQIVRRRPTDRIFINVVKVFS